MTTPALAQAQTILDAADATTGLWVGFDEAFLGLMYRMNADPIAAYDLRKCIAIVMADLKCDEAEAEEYFATNVAGSWMGERITPCAVHVLPDETTFSDQEANPDGPG